MKGERVTPGSRLLREGGRGEAGEGEEGGGAAAERGHGIDGIE